MSIRVEEKTLQLALVKAAGLLSITQDELAYDIVDESNGVFGLFGKKVAIEAWKKGDQPKAERRSRKSRSTARSSSETEETLNDVDREALISEIREFFHEVCARMIDEEVEVTVEEDDDRVIFNVENDYLCGQMTKNAKLAEALEHILRKKPKHLRQELPFRIFVDAGGARIQRERELVDMAMDLSGKVHENKRPIVLNYRSSYDRKIIHMALDKDDRVFTKSVGTGPNRKLMIIPAKEHAAEVH